MRKTFLKKLKKVAVSQDEMLVCRNCGEHLDQVDIEHFPRCPYCDFEIERSSQVEDFLMRPIVEHWINSCQYPAGPGEGYFKSINIS